MAQHAGDPRPQSRLRVMLTADQAPEAAAGFSAHLAKLAARFSRTPAAASGETATAGDTGAASRDAAKELGELVDARLETLERAIADDIGTMIEVAQAQHGTAQANLAVIQSAGAAQDAYLALLTAMGLSPLTKIRIADVSGRELTKSMVAPVESFIAEALARRSRTGAVYDPGGAVSHGTARRDQPDAPL